MTKTPNHITIYSSGMADFKRSHILEAGKEEKISVPVKEDHIGDVLVSLKVYGKVMILSPPSFTPQNANAGILQINPTKAQDELYIHLSGADIKISPKNAPPIEGQLIGRDVRSRNLDNGTTVLETLVSIFTNDKKVKRFSLDDIQELEFTDEKVKDEIDKALASNYRKIKQGNTFLDLSLKTLDDKEDTEVTIQYMIPLAAPKYTYRISTGKVHAARLEGLVVVDNNTDDDFEECFVAVANGQPISFTTDIAEIRNPLRGNVNVVANSALGAVDVEDGYEMFLESTQEHPEIGAAKGFIAPTGASRSLRAMSFASSAMTPGYETAGSSNRSQAVRQEAVVKEVGDYQLLTSETPMTIPAKKSALVPLFSQDIPSARSVLIYKPRKHSSRLFRAVQFTNSTEKNLSRGVASIFLDGVNVGEGILEDTKKDEVRLIPYQLETGVKIHHEEKDIETQMTHIKIADGNYISDSVRRCVSIYHLESKQNEEYRAYLEYDAVLGAGSDFTVVTDDESLNKRVEQISTGWRVVINLKPNKKTEVKVVEKKTDVQNARLAETTFWNWVSPIETLKQNPEILLAKKVSDEIAALIIDHKELQDEKTSHIELQKRVTGFLTSVSEGEQRTNWTKDIADAEQSIRDIDKVKIPQINNQLKAKREELKQLLSKIAVDLDLKK